MKHVRPAHAGRWNRNNLDRSSSPYLRQHAGNPIWWQEWNSETLDHAAAEGKPLFVSVGYATCHWCHVMAAGAFSDNETADYLNNNFVSIKIDREQRPDIDQYMMHFIQSQTGSGGWPLNVFLTADIKPVHALTYAPATTSGNSYSFLYIAQAVNEHMQSKGDSIMPFSAGEQEAPQAHGEQITDDMAEYFDSEYGGFGRGQKFPPHSSLLFMLYQLTIHDDKRMREMVVSTLDAMMLRGLNDHLQGGIYRYCVDREWTIPHFEKMLYDQAMALWTYSLASRVTGKEEYRTMAGKILKGLDETFEKEGFYASAFNADTGHKEGATYLWNESEIGTILTPAEMNRFRAVYEVSAEGNFEGLNHLLRKNSGNIEDIEEKLLTVRRQRSQPSRDDKILSGLNALAVVGLIQAGRHLGRPELEGKAAVVVWRLLETFWDGTSLAHSSYDGVIQRQKFLSDAGALLLALTMLYETDESWGETMTLMADYVRSFRDDGGWVESDAEDFRKVYASWFDHPSPSAVSLAETGLTRFALLTGDDVSLARYRRVHQSDFYNINVLLSEDMFPLYTTIEPVAWEKIPVNALQKRGEPESVCHNKVCRILDPAAEK